MIKNLTEASFKKEINAHKPVIIDFWASWCGPCRMLSPVIDALSEEYEGKISVGKVNVDEEDALAAQLGIVSIPTVIIFRGGTEVKRMIGVHGADQYRDEIDAVL